MKKKLCAICNSRVAARSCLRFESEVCSRCCGSTRSLRECNADCEYLKPLVLKEMERGGRLPFYRVLRTRAPGSVIVIVSREKANGELQFIDVLVDLWKMGLKDCCGAHEISKHEFSEHLSLAHYLPEETEFVAIEPDEALWLIKQGLRIAGEVGTRIPEEFHEFKYILGDMSHIEVGGSLYKCYKCEEADLQNEVCNAIKAITQNEIKEGVCGSFGEVMFYPLCSECEKEPHKQKGETQATCPECGKEMELVDFVQGGRIGNGE